MPKIISYPSLLFPSSLTSFLSTKNILFHTQKHILKLMTLISLGFLIDNFLLFMELLRGDGRIDFIFIFWDMGHFEFIIHVFIYQLVLLLEFAQGPSQIVHILGLMFSVIFLYYSLYILLGFFFLPFFVINLVNYYLLVFRLNPKVTLNLHRFVVFQLLWFGLFCLIFNNEFGHQWTEVIGFMTI